MAISLLFTGDVVPHDRTANLFKHKDIHALFADNVLSVIQNTDYSIVNYEAPIILDGRQTPIRKSGPNLHSMPEAMEVLKDAGFDMVTLANNHFRDQGQLGVENTIDHADKIGMKHVGGGKSLGEARRFICQRIKGKTFAFINACEHEWSIAEKGHGGSNPYDLINIHHDITEARKRAEYVILIIHGGIEHYQLPSPRMKREYRYFVELGADAIINHHQHCFSGYEVYRGKPIYYGLGNFCFDRQAYRTNGLWDKGLMVRVVFDDEKICHEVIPIQQCADTPDVRFLDNEVAHRQITELNVIIQDDLRVEEEFDKWAESKSHQRISQLNAFGNKCIDKLYKRGWLGSLHSRQRLYAIKDLLWCESHFDTVKQIVKNEIEKQRK